MTRCEQMNHHTRNGLMILVGLVKLHVDQDHQRFFIEQIERIEKALEGCDCELKDTDAVDCVDHF